MRREQKIAELKQIIGHCRIAEEHFEANMIDCQRHLRNDLLFLRRAKQLVKAGEDKKLVTAADANIRAFKRAFADFAELIESSRIQRMIAEKMLKETRNEA
jgi:hypothetical protein